MEVDWCVAGVSPTLERWLGVNHHSSSLLRDGTDHSPSDSIVVVRVRQARIICWTAGNEHRAEGLVIVLSSDIVSSELIDLIALAHSINSGMDGLVGCSAIFRLLVR